MKDLRESIQQLGVRCGYDGDTPTKEELDEIMALVQQEVREARIQENQIPLDRINNYKPEPGEITAANFGSAGAGMVEASWKRYFEDRLDQLREEN